MCLRLHLHLRVIITSTLDYISLHSQLHDDDDRYIDDMEVEEASVRTDGGRQIFESNVLRFSLSGVYPIEEAVPGSMPTAAQTARDTMAHEQVP